MDEPQTVLPLAVIGAGFSGTMVAIHLLRRLPPGRPILLFERSSHFAHGLAYGTVNRNHLLNVRASNMSAFPDEPEHFARWLEGREGDGVCDGAAGAFAPRGVYGRYLEDLLTASSTDQAGDQRLRLRKDDVTDLVPTPSGYTVHVASGERVPVAGAVLACGNLRAGRRYDGRHAVDPWATSPLDDLTGDEPLLIVGTGLTMIDAVAAVRDRGFAGPIIAVSRRGLLPCAHAPAPAWPQPVLAPGEDRSLLRLLVRVRAEIAKAAGVGLGWRSVIDSLRPASNALWQGLPQAERERFLRHLRAYWDVHRHRAAPPAAEMIARERASGRLRVVRGKIETIRDLADGAIVTLRERGARHTRDLGVRRIVDASGVGRVVDTEDLLLRRLLARGLVAPDGLGLGLNVTEGFTALDRHGCPARSLWTLGPLLRGTLWECTAVPDIRSHAANLARAVVEAMDGLGSASDRFVGGTASARS